MDFTIHQLQIFGAVVMERSITGAARKLHMTQPAVSIQMKQLQQHVGMELYENRGKQFRLTDAGEELYQLYLSVMNRMNTFDSTLSQIKGGLKGTLSISAASTAMYIMPYLLGEFQKEFEEVEISLKVTNRFEVINHITNQDYSLAILTQVPDRDNLESIPFLKNPLVFAAHPSHPLAGRRLDNLKALQNETFIIREQGSGTRMVMEKLLEDAGLQPKIGMELGTNEAVKQAIMAGIGVSLVSELSLTSERRLEKISVLDIEGLPVNTYWHAIYRRGRKVNPVTEHFLSFLERKKRLS